MFDYKAFQFPEPIIVRQPEYPLDRKAFDRALTTGHGRTLLHAHRYGVEPFKDLILDAALRCRFREPMMQYNPRPPCPISAATDIQGWSLARLCLMAGVADEVLDTPIEDEGNYHYWNAVQRDRIAEELVELGHMPPPPEWDEIHSDWEEGWKQRIRTGGEVGMLAVAEAFGRELSNPEKPSVWEVSHAVVFYEGLHGAGAAMRLLTPETARNPAIRRFVRVYRRNQLWEERVRIDEEAEARNYPPSPPRPSRSTLEYVCGEEESSFAVRLRAKHPTLDERNLIQLVLYESESPLTLATALRRLREIGLAEFDPALLSLVAHDEEYVRDAAAHLFSRYDQPEVREAALSAMARGDKITAFNLFGQSARNGDSVMVLELLRDLCRHADFFDPHMVYIRPVHCFRDNTHLTEPVLPLFVYEYSPCRVCRSEAFRLMVERDCCPDWVMEEAPYDAMPGMREVAAGAQAWPPQRRDQVTLIRQLLAAEPAATAASINARFGHEDHMRLAQIERIMNYSLKEPGRL